jgi:hypothetical protein
MKINLDIAEIQFGFRVRMLPLPKKIFFKCFKKLTIFCIYIFTI